MITMTKAAFQELVFLAIAKMDEQSETYKQFCNIVLHALGVITPDETLSPEYALSPLWSGGTDDEPLQPSVIAELAAKIPMDQWPVLSDALSPLTPSNTTEI